ncbi:hypothetical protein BDV59DRAFT_173188 [Aspergillus ambiguus]|uniref:Mpv17/PMP22 family protein n=1 Tax=Aspergillus ambiguus TaxID=176160 RepID=UPI003CCDFA88
MRHTLFTQFSRRTTTSSRSSLPPRIRPRRNQSSGTSNPEPVPEAKNPPQNAQLNPQHQPSSTTPSTPAPTATSSSAPAVRSKSLRQVILDGPIGRVGRSYARIQERRPYATQLWSTVVVYLCGDLSAQLLFPPESKDSAKREDSPSESAQDNEGTVSEGGYDPFRTMRHLVVGAGSSIPSYNWFMFLHNHFNFPSKFLSILTKVVVQQSVFTPVFNTYFFSVHSLLSGASLEETWERLKKALPVSITNSAKLWPAVTAFSFMYIPAQFRNIFSGCIAVGWQTYLSWLNQKAAREVEAAEQADAGSSPIALTPSVTAKA